MNELSSSVMGEGEQAFCQHAHDENMVAAALSDPLNANGFMRQLPVLIEVGDVDTMHDWLRGSVGQVALLGEITPATAIAVIRDSDVVMSAAILTGKRHGLASDPVHDIDGFGATLIRVGRQRNQNLSRASLRDYISQHAALYPRSFTGSDVERGFVEGQQDCYVALECALAELAPVDFNNASPDDFIASFGLCGECSFYDAGGAELYTWSCARIYD